MPTNMVIAQNAELISDKLNVIIYCTDGRHVQKRVSVLYNQWDLVSQYTVE
jgi:hypothetical protein